MENRNVTYNLDWIDEAFLKDYVDELEAACCLTDGQTEVYISNKVTKKDIEYINSKVRTNYEFIQAWQLGRMPFFSFFDKALEQNVPYLRWFTLLKKCEEFLLNSTEEKQNAFIKKYPNIDSRLRMLLSERRRYSRCEYNVAPSDITRLSVRYTLEQAQKILEEAEKANFIIFSKVIHLDNTESFVSLTPTEVTAVRNNHPDKTNVIIGFFYCNVNELWVRKDEADKLLQLMEEISGSIATEDKNIIEEVLIKPETQEKYNKQEAYPSLLGEDILQLIKDEIKNEKFVFPSDKKKSFTRSKPYRRQMLESFVKHLVDSGIYDTFSKFQNAIMSEFLYDSGDSPEDHETYNEHTEVKRVYGVFVSDDKSKSLKKKKYKVHFSFITSSGHLKPWKPLSLCSFKDIFDTVRANLNKERAKLSEGN